MTTWTQTMRLYAAVALTSLWWQGIHAATKNKERRMDAVKPPNVVVFMVDDLGWNQVGYHANRVGNQEIYTPHIDAAVANGGIELDRGYMTPWSGPSRAAVQTGRTNALNANLSSGDADYLSNFENSLRLQFVSGVQPGTRTLAQAFADYGESTIGQAYQTYYSGKWGIGGAAWSNTPMGLGYDSFMGFWGNGIDTCDAYVPYSGQVQKDNTFLLFEEARGPSPMTALPGYWVQNRLLGDNDFCEFLRSLSPWELSESDKEIACKSHPRNPPKLIDDDLVQRFRYQVYQHDQLDEDAAPFFHMISTANLHLPLVYPAKYNTMNADRLPRHFAENRVKPAATNNDTRLATANLLQYVDDLFGQCIEALKQNPGVWENTIVYFTSDNGGAVHDGVVNNNYPLRASKGSPWEGGTRVAQFLTGGWLDANLPANRTGRSDTFIFPQDIGPTLLEMAGATEDYLLLGREGAVYGRPMWEYIKNSVDRTKEPETHQLERQASFAPSLFYDVQSNRTMKSIVTGDSPQPIPRTFAPIWPMNEHLITDQSYYSVKPCRPGGIAQDCCYFDVTADPTESNPLSADCLSMSASGAMFYDVAAVCPPLELPILQDHMCLDSSDIRAPSPNAFSLWSQFRSAGPLTNMAGNAIDQLPMKCVCEFIAPDTRQDEVDGYIMTVLTQPICVSTSKLPASFDTRRVIPCDGSFSNNAQGGMLEAYETQGVNVTALQALIDYESQENLHEAVRHYYHVLLSYANRQRFREWPNLSKWPMIVYQMDSCKFKDGLPVPVPVLTITPFSFGAMQQLLTTTRPFETNEDGDLGTRAQDYVPTVGLCFPHDATRFYCPSVQNANLTQLASWDFDSGPRGTFVDGRTWEPMSVSECLSQCGISAEHASYIGSGSWGLAVD